MKFFVKTPFSYQEKLVDHTSLSRLEVFEELNAWVASVTKDEVIYEFGVVR